MNRDSVNKSVLLILVIGVSALFLAMIRHFLMAIFLAGIFSALSRPLFIRFTKLFRGHQVPAALATILVLMLVLVLPLVGLLGVVTAQAVKVGQSITPWINARLAQPTAFADVLGSLPFYAQIEPYQEPILRKAGEMVGQASAFLINGLRSGVAMGVNFIVSQFILLYTMFFFLLDGEKLLTKILYYLPLEDRDERRMLDKFTSVSRATLKGTAVIGIIQGGLAGSAFVAVGIESAVFWGTIMTVLSIIPGVGTALVWGPAALILVAGGHFVKGIGLALFCALVVGSVDNLLRPKLVGKDTQLHELFIFFSTLGGIAFFGVVGFIIGPIIAALFVTLWDIYGEVFQEVLPRVRQARRHNAPKPPADTIDPMIGRDM